MNTEAIFLEALQPTTRKLLVSARVAAMRGRCADVCAKLSERVAATIPSAHLEITALGLLWSELLYLDGQGAEALRVFDTVVKPQQASLPTTVQLVTTDNLSVLQMGELLGEGATTFYHLVDRRRVAQFDASDRDTILAAHSAIEKDRLTEALPLLWQNLLRAHSLACWRASKWAAERLAKLYLKVGDLEHACHYLVAAEAVKEMEQLADATATRGDQTIIRTVLRRLMDFANLRRHFMVACKFIAKIPDLIPDSDVETLAQWLLPRCREPAAHNGGGVMHAAWDAIRELGHRLAETTSQQFLEAALSHPDWLAPLPGENRFLPHREILVKAVTFLVHAAPKVYLAEVVEGTLPLATERAQDHDYEPVVNLLCNLSELGGDALRERIKTALYLPGKPLNRLLLQVAGDFGVTFPPTQWEELADRIANEIRLTVQRLKPGESAKPVAETLMTMNQSTPVDQLQVTVQSGAGLQAVVSGKKYLSDEGIDRIVRVLVEMASNQDNLLSNREYLLSALCEFADRAQPRLCDEVVRALEPLARGFAIESADSSNSASGHPLASARMNFGTPQQVQAIALVAAATYCGSDAARYRILSEALVEGFVSPPTVVRKGAYAAARRLPRLSSEDLLPILMGLRDPEPVAAIAAFAAFAERKEWSMTRPMWKLFLLAARLASKSTNSSLRRHAAVALRSRIEDAPTEATRNDAQAIMEVFAGDLAFSVREVVTR